MHKHFYGIPKSVSFIKIHTFYVQLFTYPNCCVLFNYVKYFTCLFVIILL